jgi:hypothetical protein
MTYGPPSNVLKPLGLGPSQQQNETKMMEVTRATSQHQEEDEGKSSKKKQ